MGKIVIYQIFTRLYGNRKTTRKRNGSLRENGCGKMTDIDKATLSKLRDMGITHVWYTGIVRHASQTDHTKSGIPRQHPAIVKGKAGSPYAIVDYYDVDPDIAKNVASRMHEFELLVRRTHNAGLKVITDFVPNHVGRQYQSIAKPQGVADLGENDNPSIGFTPRNNFYYCPDDEFSPSFDLYAGEAVPYRERPAKATGNDVFSAHPGRNDWYETVKLNYGVDYYAGGVGYYSPVPETWKQMLDIVLFWAGKGVDGVRCDMAEMVPAAFWAWMTPKVKLRYPDFIFIGEVYNPREYRDYIGAGFNYLYDKVGMYDTMRAVTCGNAPAAAITNAWQSTDDIGDHMLYFLENHDEQRLASDFFAGDGLRGVPALVASVLMRKNPYMLYFAEEYGERGMDEEGFSGLDGRTTIFDYWSLDTLCRAANGELTDNERRLYDIHRKVLRIANDEKAASEGATFDLMYANGGDGFDTTRHYAFLRKWAGEMLLVVVNFADSDAGIKVRIPAHAFDHMDIAEGDYTATDLLSGDKLPVSLVRDGAIAMTVAARGARVYKITM